jgi:anti-sigma B factor antagonist
MGAIPEFHVDVQQRGRLRIVIVAGEVDVLTAPQLGAAVDDEEAYDDLVIDLRAVPFMSSVGLGLISSINRRQTRRGRGFALASVKGDVEQLLEITGLTEALLIGETVPAAIDLVRGSGGYYDT